MLGLAVASIAVAAVLGAQPKGARQVSNTKLMGVARFRPLVFGLMLAFFSHFVLAAAEPPMNIDWEGIVVRVREPLALITHFFDRETRRGLQVVKDGPAETRKLTASPRFVALPKEPRRAGKGEMELFLSEVEKRSASREASDHADGGGPLPSLSRSPSRGRPARRQSSSVQASPRPRARGRLCFRRMGIPFEKIPSPQKRSAEFPGGAPAARRPDSFSPPPRQPPPFLCVLEVRGWPAQGLAGQRRGTRAALLRARASSRTEFPSTRASLPRALGRGAA